MACSARGSGGAIFKEDIMKTDIHPNYADIKVTCSCGHIFETRSTLGRNLSIEVCSQCHPFYTGKQKIIDTAGRVDRFMQKFGVVGGKATPAPQQDQDQAKQ